MRRKRLRVTGIVVGDPGVGRSSLVDRWRRRLPRGRTPRSRLKFSVTRQDKRHKVVRLDLEELRIGTIMRWHPAHTARWEAKLLVLVFDVTRPRTLEHLHEAWLNLLRVTGNHLHVVLVSNKMDALREPLCHPDFRSLWEMILLSHPCCFVPLRMSCIYTSQGLVDVCLRQVLHYLYTCPRITGCRRPPEDYQVTLLS